MSGAPTITSVDDAWAAIDAATSFLSRLDLDASPAALPDLVRETTVRRRRLDAIGVRVLDAFDRHGAWTRDGAPSGGAWLRANLRVSPAQARTQVRTARRLRELPALSGALTEGAIDLAHVEVVTAAMARTPARAATIAAAEPTFAAAARELDPAQLARVVARWAHTVDPAGVVEAECAVHAQRFLSVSRTFDGAVAINGLLAPEPGALLMTALEACSTADYRSTRGTPDEPSADTAASKAPPDERTSGQRRADALVALASGYLDSGQAPEIAGVRPHLHLAIALTSLAAAPDAPGHHGGELEGVGPVSAEAARRIGCDASVTAIGIDATGMPLSYGRTTRVVPPALRRFLVARDRGCRFPGCDRPASWSQAHHLVHWSRGGETSADNLVLTCQFHHHALHEGGFTTTGSAGPGLRFHRPDGTDLVDRARAP